MSGRTYYYRPSSVPGGADTAPLSNPLPGTEADARADIAKRYAQVPDGKLVDLDIASLLNGAEVAGARFIWSTSPTPRRPAIDLRPWVRCPSCDYRTPDASPGVACPKCQEGTLASLGSPS